MGIKVLVNLVKNEFQQSITVRNQRIRNGKSVNMPRPMRSFVRNVKKTLNIERDAINKLKHAIKKEPKKIRIGENAITHKNELNNGNVTILMQNIEKKILRRVRCG